MMMLAMMVAAGLMAPASFRAELEAAAGQPVRLDPRLTIPACASGHRFERRATAVDVTCPDHGWRLMVPIAVEGRGTGEALVKRGSGVVVEAGGPGYAVRVDGVAEADAAAGDMVRVRNLRSGQRLVARVLEDGRLRVDDR